MDCIGNDTVGSAVVDSTVVVEDIEDIEDTEEHFEC